MTPFGTPRCFRTWRASNRTPGILHHPCHFDCLCTRPAGHEADENEPLRLCRCQCGETAAHEATQAFNNDEGRR